MANETTLFEVSWEVCNKVGGIHTVVSTKAKTLVERYGDGYVAIGPWLLGNKQSEESFEDEPGLESFAESCRKAGVPVRIGRWKIPGAPRTLLVEFSGLFANKDAILSGLWEKHRVDSLTGGWDYVEPVLFGYAAGMVIERWWQEFVAPRRGRAVAQFHEWMIGSGLLYLRERAPAVGTVFTTHATVLGRALASQGRQPELGLDGRKPEEVAESLGVRAKHSMEKTCAAESDVFTTVSEITAREAELFHARRAQPLLPNGIDLEVMDELAGGVGRAEARAKLTNLASRFLGEDSSRATLLLLSGRYEFHNKGIDVLLESLAEVNGRPGRPLILFLMVPAGQTGVSHSVLQRMSEPLDHARGPLGITTHNLIDRERDPIQQATERWKLDNAPGSRVKVIQIPIYLNRSDGLLDQPYEAVLGGMDLTVFPSFYEPWGYTPEESLAVGVPTVTTDLAGFGRWADAERLGPHDGIFLLRREGIDDTTAARSLAQLIETFLAETPPSTGDARDAASRGSMAEICRRTAQRTAWSDLIEHYFEAFRMAEEQAQERAGSVPAPRFVPKVQMPVSPAPQGRHPRLVGFDVSATLPAALRGLERLARNYYWSWDPEGHELFRDLSPASWRTSGHNPVVLLRIVFPEDLHAKAADAGYVAKLERVLARLDAYLASAPRSVPVKKGGALSRAQPVAYFCAEFGIHESLRIYSGGLGILAGDHLKSASDLGLPLVGVGLFYRLGYLRQRLSPAGDQIALDAENEPRNLPLELVRDPRGEPIHVTLQLPSSTLVLRAWRLEVGRVTLYLLDADMPENRPEERAITHHLYGGDQEARLRQEIALGRGGVRLLARLGIEPAVWHINEGHAAFQALERVGRLVREEGLTFDEARELVRATTVFTTHTPVPAGHDRFGEDLMRRYFSDATNWLGLAWERFMALGQSAEERGTFNMTSLALAFAEFANGVSKLHGEVSKDLLHSSWPGLLKTEVPIRSITNGVHLASWTDPELARLLGAEGRPIAGADFVARAGSIPIADLWRVRVAARARLVAKARANLERGFLERHDSPSALARMLEGLDERAMLIGFARRFAPYKRAGLLFRDPERLKALFADESRPLRLIFAGKAHPKDMHGQEVLKSIVALSRREEFLGKVILLEDYDVELARVLVQGVDVWLNNPIRTLEASGTSGMKAAANGVLNLSIPDGWWVEGYDGSNGWSIGDGRVYPSSELQDELDSANLCRLLREEVLPLFFERDGAGVPVRWLERARRSLASVPPIFNTDRMVAEYRDQAYLELGANYFALTGDGKSALKQLALDRQRLRRGFAEIEFVSAHVSDLSDLRVGDVIEARVDVDLKGLSPDDVQVELVLGHTFKETNLRNAQFVRLAPIDGPQGSVWHFEGAQRLNRSGSFGSGIRVRAKESASSLRDLVLWA